MNTYYIMRHSLFSAAITGNLVQTRSLIENYGLYQCPWWLKPEEYQLLCEAIEYNHIEIAKILLSKIFTVNSHTYVNYPANTPLHLAVLTGNFEIIQMLLIRHANINAKNQFGDTPIHTAIKVNKIEILKLLLQYKANIIVQNNIGTALHIATIWCREEVVKILLDQNAMVDYKDVYGRTPLHFPRIRSITEMLLKFGANINLRDKYGRTALHYASEKGHLKVLRTLLYYGADINITSLENETPLQHGMLGFTIRENQSAHPFVSHERRVQIPFDFAVATAFNRHVSRLKAANFHVSEENLQSIHGFMCYKLSTTIDFYDKCKDEIIHLKNEKISDTNISFYDILAKDTSTLAIPYMRNDNIVQVLKSNDYKNKFPIYAGMIEGKFIRVMVKKGLLEKANTICSYIFRNLPQLPYNCTEEIMSYLNTEELRAFLDACEHF